MTPRCVTAFDLIVDLVGQERTRGTLLDALEPYECSPILPLLVELAIADTYESARMAARCIAGIRAEVADALWAELRARLRTAYEAIDPPWTATDPERGTRFSEFFAENSAGSPS